MGSLNTQLFRVPLRRWSVYRLICSSVQELCSSVHVSRNIPWYTEYQWIELFFETKKEKPSSFVKGLHYFLNLRSLILPTSFTDFSIFPAKRFYLADNEKQIYCDGSRENCHRRIGRQVASLCFYLIFYLGDQTIPWLDPLILLFFYPSLSCFLMYH